MFFHIFYNSACVFISFLIYNLRWWIIDELKLRVPLKIFLEKSTACAYFRRSYSHYQSDGANDGRKSSWNVSRLFKHSVKFMCFPIRGIKHSVLWEWILCVDVWKVAQSCEFLCSLLHRDSNPHLLEAASVILLLLSYSPLKRWCSSNKWRRLDPSNREN